MVKSINLKAWFCATAIVVIFIGILAGLNQRDVKDETARMAKLSHPHITVSIR
jgi:hypothetical protein